MESSHTIVPHNILDIVPVLSKEFHKIQVITDSRFTLNAYVIWSKRTVQEVTWTMDNDPGSPDSQLTFLKAYLRELKQNTSNILQQPNP